MSKGKRRSAPEAEPEYGLADRGISGGIDWLLYAFFMAVVVAGFIGTAWHLWAVS